MPEICLTLNMSGKVNSAHQIAVRKQDICIVIVPSTPILSPKRLRAIVTRKGIVLPPI